MPLSYPALRKNARASSKFLYGQHGRGAMFDEFCNSGLVDLAQVIQRGVTKARIFEYEWGFVAESCDKDHGWSWNLYVQHVWRTGTTEWWERFEAGHQRLVQSHMSAIACDQGCEAGPQLQFVRGEQAFCAATYLTGCRKAWCARTWVGSRLLPLLWPQVLKQAFDPVFETSAFSRLD